MRTIAYPPPASDDPDAHRLILRDGSAVKVRPAVPADAGPMQQFFERLSPESRYNRFLTTALPPKALIDRFCDSPDPARGLTLIALRHLDDEERIIAVATYLEALEKSAEVAFAIDEPFQGKGLGTLLLEQLGAKAAANGLQRFVATTSASNRAMREVFRDSGFQIRAVTSGGDVDVQLLLAPSSEGVASSERRRQSATVQSIRPLLAPASIVVIGASSDPGKIGSRILQAIREGDFTGSVQAVHPTASEIQGLVPLRSARDLPRGIDLAIVAVPAAAILSVVDDCASAGVRSLLVVSAGFAEIGGAGKGLQDELVDRVRGYGMRLIGPNCMGAMNLAPEVRLNASFSPVVPSPGHLAFSSQSGALGIAVLGMAVSRGLGLSAFVSVGNKADVSTNDLLEFWETDPLTRVILLYVESFGNPRRFGRIARRVGRTKPIVALKAGRTAAGSRAASSHTAALASSDVAVDALFHQTGVIRVDTIDEMFDVAECLDAQPLPAGSRVALVTNAGGPGILAADACESAGLSVVELTADTREKLRACLTPSASLANPVDMIATAGPNEYRRTVEIALAADETDAVIVILTPVDSSSTEAIVRSTQGAVERSRAAGFRDKPVLACVVAESFRPLPRAGDERIPTYRFPENAVRALGRVAAYARWRRQVPGLIWAFDDIDTGAARAICRNAVATRGAGWLSSVEVGAVLGAFGVPTAQSALAHSPDEAVALASAVGFPVAAKLASRAAVHKTDMGAVRLGLATPEAVYGAYQEIAKRGLEIDAASLEGVLIQSMIQEGVETLVGVTHDPLFGPLVGFGLGGVNVEIWHDVQFRIAPVTDIDADHMIRDIRGLPLLQGYRGRKAVDLDALRELILRISRLAEEIHEIVELDLNPVMALAAGQGCRVVDARIRVAAHATG